MEYVRENTFMTFPETIMWLILFVVIKYRKAEKCPSVFLPPRNLHFKTNIVINMQMPCDYHKRVREAASEPCRTVGIKIQPRSAERGISGPPQREGPVPQQRTWWVMTGHQPLGAPIPAPASWPEPLAALVAPGEVPFLWRRHRSRGLGDVLGTRKTRVQKGARKP